MGLKESGLRGSLRSVSVRVGIPNSVDYRLPMDEGAGTTLNPDIGTATATLTGGWSSDTNAVGGWWTTYDGVDDEWRTDSEIDINQTNFTVIQWVSISSGFETGDRLLFGRDDAGNGGGWDIFLRTDVNESENGVEFATYDTSFNNGPRVAEIPTNERVMVAGAADGDTHTLYLYDTSGLIDKQSDTVSRETTASETLVGMNRDDGSTPTEGQADALAAAFGTTMSQSQIEQYWDSTR